MEQLSLFDIPSVADKWQVQNFSADNFGEQSARMSLEKKLIDITVVSDKFNRQNVSYQLSKNDALHRWLKYKEGFSADLVKRLIKEFDIKQGDTILDPFVGSGTTSLVCKMQGINSIGFNILPMSEIAIKAKQSVLDYNLAEIKQIISPPYCNRYDYTRTYALELAYLGITDEKIKKLRQELLSCTVENKPKIDYIREHYTTLSKEKEFNQIMKIIENNKTLSEINHSLNERSKNGDINNKGVLRMVNGYFLELTFIYAELFRLCKSRAKVAFVNDNVRYGGEVISVDYISTELAEQIGFKPVKVYSLKQQKGNSSQQMAKYGRVPLRKSITVWNKC